MLGNKNKTRYLCHNITYLGYNDSFVKIMNVIWTFIVNNRLGDWVNCLVQHCLKMLVRKHDANIIQQKDFCILMSPLIWLLPFSYFNLQSFTHMQEIEHLRFLFSLPIVVVKVCLEVNSYLGPRNHSFINFCQPRKSLKLFLHESNKTYSISIRLHSLLCQRHEGGCGSKKVMGRDKL